MSKIVYRPEIDGLRAIAILGVIIYHAEFSVGRFDIFSGGYLGVDVFLVISGFLISSIILTELENHEFKLSNFFFRRIRRILPLFLTVLIVVTPLAYSILFPKEIEEYRRSLFSSLGFVANFWFWMEDSYVAEASKFKPLLHLWSLSLEEQFYLFLPIFIIWVYRFEKRTSVFILFFTALLSLIMADILSFNKSEAVFYLLPFRIWEFLVGIIIAFVSRDQESQILKSFSFLSYVGFSMIVGAFIFFDEMTRHPSFLTLFPVLGTALILLNNYHNNILIKILSSKYFTRIGLLSYGIYLWHYPFFALARTYFGSLTDLYKVIILLSSFILSIFTYRFVENPARKKIKFYPLMCGLSSIVFFLIFCNLYLFKNNFGNEFDRYGLTFSSEAYLTQIEGRSCFRPIPEFGEHCQFFVNDPKGTIVAVGDSHMASLSRGLYELAKKKNMNYVQMPDCVFILNTDIITKKGVKLKNDCSEKVLAELKKLAPSVVILSSRMALRLTGQYPSGGIYNKYIPEKNSSLTIDGLIKFTIQNVIELKHKVIQVYPIPEMNNHIPKGFRRLAIKRNISGDDLVKLGKKFYDISYENYIVRNKTVITIYNSLKDENFFSIKPWKVLCDEKVNTCKSVMDKNLLYSDDNHLSNFGASLVVQQVEDLLNNKIM